MFKKSYQPEKKNEHEILMEELFDPKKHNKNEYKSIFDYKSINEYKSIHKYDSLHRQNNNAVEYDVKPLYGTELLINYGIVTMFYLLMVAFMPFSLFFCLKVKKFNLDQAFKYK
jgi:hypothetical protein